MPQSRDLDPEECRRLLSCSVVGRVAVATPEGPHIIPVNYSLFEDTVVIRTSSYTLLGTYGRDAMLAFEIDGLDQDRHEGWSVTARGRSFAELDPATVKQMRGAWRPHPWVDGQRNLYLRIPLASLTGRLLGSPPLPIDKESAPQRTLSAS